MNRLVLADPESVRRARDAFTRAVALRPAFGDAWPRQAVALAAERKNDEAIAILKDLVANVPTPGQADMARRLLEQLRAR